MILDIFEYCIKALRISYNELKNGGVIYGIPRYMPLNIMRIVNDCHCHSSSSIWISNPSRKLSNSTLHDADSYHTQLSLSHAALPWFSVQLCQWQPLPVVLGVVSEHAHWIVAVQGNAQIKIQFLMYSGLAQARPKLYTSWFGELG